MSQSYLYAMQGAAASAALLLTAQPAMAEIATSQVGVFAKVTKNCTVQASPLQFGDINIISGTAFETSGSLTITCTAGTSYTLTGPGATGTRKMVSAENATKTLSYTMYTNEARTTAWVDGGETKVGSGTTQSMTIYGRIPAGQTSAIAGSYSDTVAVTLTY